MCFIALPFDACKFISSVSFGKKTHNIFHIILSHVILHYKDEAKHIVVKQMDKTSVMLSWPDLTNSSIDATMLSGFDVSYNSTYPNYSCHQGFFTTNVKVHIQYYFF